MTTANPGSTSTTCGSMRPLGERVGNYFEERMRAEVFVVGIPEFDPGYSLIGS